MMRYILVLILMSSLLFSGCKSDYERLLDEELASGKRHDTLFLGIHFGMSRKDFYTHCWEMNRDGIIRQGANNASVLYAMEDQLKSPADMNFYPNFVNSNIYEMPVIFNYKGWAPWNNPLHSDSLLVDVLGLLNEWHGGREFVKVESEGERPAYVKVDGNRRILVHPMGDKDVRVLYTDMSVKIPQKAMPAADDGQNEAAQK